MHFVCAATTKAIGLNAIYVEHFAFRDVDHLCAREETPKYTYWTIQQHHLRLSSKRQAMSPAQSNRKLKNLAISYLGHLRRMGPAETDVFDDRAAAAAALLFLRRLRRISKILTTATTGHVTVSLFFGGHDIADERNRSHEANRQEEDRCWTGKESLSFCLELHRSIEVSHPPEFPLVVTAPEQSVPPRDL